MNLRLVKTFDLLPRVELMPGFQHVRYQKDMSKICDSGNNSRYTSTGDLGLLCATMNLPARYGIAGEKQVK
jgi:hypothetical protein